MNFPRVKELLPQLLMLIVVTGAAQKVPRTYIAHITSGPIQIDGHAWEPSWNNAQWSELFTDIEGVKKPAYDTRFKMLWDKDNLYFFAELQEPHVWGTLKQRDTVIFYNNDFEIFIDPDGDTHNYYEFEINALNTTWDLFLTKPYRNQGKVLNSWNMAGVKTAIDINGTLNNPMDTDKGWNIEIAIPWSEITEASATGKVPADDFWRLNFSRVNWDHDLIGGKYSRKKDPNTGTYLPEYNWVWSAQEVINMHEPERWGYVYFSTIAAGGENGFTIPKDEYIKWQLYSWYRMIRARKEPLSEIALDSVSIWGEMVKPEMEKSAFGWNIWVKSPFTHKVMSVSKDGKYEVH